MIMAKDTRAGTLNVLSKSDKTIHVITRQYISVVEERIHDAMVHGHFELRIAALCNDYGLPISGTQFQIGHVDEYRTYTFAGNGRTSSVGIIVWDMDTEYFTKYFQHL